MKLSTVYILFILTVLLGCKTSQNHSFIKSESKKQIRLIGVKRPYVVFLLERGDTLKFSKEDIFALLDNHFKNQTKRQTLSDKSLLDIAQALTNTNKDTLVYQNLSSVGSKTLSGILDSWIARELLFKGKALVALKNQTDNPKRLNYVFTKDNLGGQQGTFYSVNGAQIYSSVITLGE